MTPRVHSFCWHNVEGTWCFPGTGGRRRLEQQLTWLARTTNVLDLGEVVTRLRNGDRLPPRTTTVTFDDGYADNLALAVPVLERLGIPATFFLVPGLLSREADPWWERVSHAVARSPRPSLHWQGRTWSLAGDAQRETAADQVRSALKTLDRAARHEAIAELVDQLAPVGPDATADLFLDWDGAQELVARGFAVGSHTWHHGVLSRETASEQHRELALARGDLQDRLQVPADLLAYPNGGPQDFDGHSIEAARSVGHTGACTTTARSVTGQTPPYALHRYVVSPRRGVVEFAKVAKAAVGTQVEGARRRLRPGGPSAVEHGVLVEAGGPRHQAF